MTARPLGRRLGAQRDDLLEAMAVQGKRPDLVLVVTVTVSAVLR